jgi:CxxC motif-containing protein
MTKKIEIRCIKCPLGCLAELTVDDENRVLGVANTQCKDGKDYVIAEFNSPVRVLTATVLTKSGLSKLLPVKTNRPIQKARLMDCMDFISKVRVGPPIGMGQVIVSNILNLGADLVSTDELKN